MIDRKVLWISIIVILAMTVATIWRLSLLADWHHLPLDGPGGSHTVNALFLFCQPFALAWATANFYARKWFAAGSDEAVRSWRNWQTMFLVGFCTLVGLIQVFIIGRSLGYGLAVDRPTIARIAIVATGILVVVAGNAFPKLPGLSMRFRWFQLDSWQQNRHLRFTGKLMVGAGLVFIGFGAFLPLVTPSKMIVPAIIGLTLVILAANFWHIAKLKREPSPLP